MNKLHPRRRTISLVLTLFAVTGSSSCSYLLPERYATTNPRGVRISDLPRNIRNAELEPSINRDSAVLVNVDGSDHIFVAGDEAETSLKDLGSRLRQLLERKPNKVVYIAASTNANYGAVVGVLNEVRKQDVSRVGLIVIRTRVMAAPTCLFAYIPAEPDPNQDISLLRPNPLFLRVTISPDLSLRLNTDSSGSVADPSQLAETLMRTFSYRRETFQLRPGYETRTDLSMEERVERTVTVRAARSVRYGDVVKTIDAAKGAGAYPIVLQVDDLAD